MVPGQAASRQDVVGGVAYLRGEPPPRPQPLAQVADKVGLFSEAFGHDRAGTVDGDRDVGEHRAPCR